METNSLFRLQLADLLAEHSASAGTAAAATSTAAGLPPHVARFLKKTLKPLLVGEGAARSFEQDGEVARGGDYAAYVRGVNKTLGLGLSGAGVFTLYDEKKRRKALKIAAPQRMDLCGSLGLQVNSNQRPAG